MNPFTAIVFVLAFCAAMWSIAALRRREKQRAAKLNAEALEAGMKTGFQAGAQGATAHLHIWERIPVGLVEMEYGKARLTCEADLLHCPCGALRVVEPAVRLFPPRKFRRGRGRA